MKRIHRAHSHGNEQSEKPLVLSLCRHGVSDSWATMQKLQQEITAAKNFNIKARGVDPEGTKETLEGTRGIELTIEEIRQASLLIIASSNLNYLQQRFGKELVAALISEGYLHVRYGRESQFLTKDVRNINRMRAEWHKEYADLLQHSVKRRPASEMVYSEAFEHATTLDKKWHSEKDAKIERKKHLKH